MTEADALETQLWGDCMDCSELVTALAALANAITNQKGTTVACGGGVGADTVVSCLGNLAPDQIVPQDVIEEPETSGPPPEGFDTWEEYFLRKCQASYALWAWLRNMFNTWQSASGTAMIVDSALAMITAAAVATGVFFPPGALVLMAIGIVQFFVLSIIASEKLTYIVDYLDTNKTSIICAFYNSGSALDVQNLAADAVEDAIETIEWGTLLEPLAPALEPLIASVASQFVNTNVANVLFYAAEDLLLPDAACECGGVLYEWPFDADAEGWYYEETIDEGVETTHGWTATGGDFAHPESPGHVYSTIQKSEVGQSAASSWQYDFPVQSRPVAVTGKEFVCRIGMAVGANVLNSLAIFYDDDTNDNNTNFAGESGWHTYSVAITAPNAGKHIKQLYAKFAVGATTDLKDWALDTCVLDLQ